MEFNLPTGKEIKWSWIIGVYLLGWFADTVFNQTWIRIICTIIAGGMIIPKLIDYIKWINKKIMK